MRTYAEFDELHDAFVRALKSDPAPPSGLALLWHEAIAMDRNPDAPTARTRGGAFLRYYAGPKALTEVPGQAFAQDKLPHRVCMNLISKHALSSEGPWSVTFRYERSETGEWRGGYSVETSREYEEQVRTRKEIDARMADALRAHWVGDGITRVSLVYGVQSWSEPGPKLKVTRGRDVEFLDPDEGVARAWQAMVDHLRSHGHSHVYYADIYLHKANAKLREGDNVQLRYGR